MSAAARCWVAVASAEHVRHGREHGFMQVCHGKAAPLRRIHPGDRIVYDSPTVTFRGGNWGYPLRFGLFEIGADDMDRIAEAMAARSAVSAA